MSPWETESAGRQMQEKKCENGAASGAACTKHGRTPRNATGHGKRRASAPAAGRSRPKPVAGGSHGGHASRCCAARLFNCAKVSALQARLLFTHR